MTKSKFEAHIIECMEPTTTIEEAVKSQINYMLHPGYSAYRAARDMVEGGTFLVYYGDVAKFMGSKAKTDAGLERVWQAYIEKMASTLLRIYHR